MLWERRVCTKVVEWRARPCKVVFWSDVLVGLCVQINIQVCQLVSIVYGNCGLI
jgi:hypothetical protein